MATTKTRIRGFRCVDNDGALIGTYCPDCADINWSVSDDPEAPDAYIEDGNGWELIPTRKSFQCAGCREDC